MNGNTLIRQDIIFLITPDAFNLNKFSNSNADIDILRLSGYVQDNFRCK